MIRKAILTATFLMGIVSGVVSTVSWWKPIDYFSESDPFWGVYVCDFGATIMHFELDARVSDPVHRLLAFREWQTDQEDACYSHRWFDRWHFEWRKRSTAWLVTPADQTIGTWIYVPLWLFAILLLVYPTLAFIRGPFARWRRSRKGVCLKCGYDLTGNVSGVCPECGEPA